MNAAKRKISTFNLQIHYDLVQLLCIEQRLYTLIKLFIVIIISLFDGHFIIYYACANHALDVSRSREYVHASSGPAKVGYFMGLISISKNGTTDENWSPI